MLDHWPIGASGAPPIVITLAAEPAAASSLAQRARAPSLREAAAAALLGHVRAAALVCCPLAQNNFNIFRPLPKESPGRLSRSQVNSWTAPKSDFFAGAVVQPAR